MDSIPVNPPALDSWIAWLQDLLAPWVGSAPSEASILTVLILIAGSGILFTWGVRALARATRARRRFDRRSWLAEAGNRYQSKRGLADPKVQMAAIAGIEFEKRRLMNKGEYTVFRMLEESVRQIGHGHRVMAQTSMGELLQPRGGSRETPRHRDAYASINSKRLDFAIIDRGGYLVLAIEVQGSGHHLSPDAFMRDAVKREALRRAGVEMLEVTPDWAAEEIATRVRKALGLVQDRSRARHRQSPSTIRAAPAAQP